jgi:hypothetical protein
VTSRPTPARGYVAVEFAAGVALLLVPVLLLVAVLPTWSEREHAAAVAAREAARYAAQRWPDDVDGAAVDVAEVAVTRYGVPATDVRVVMATNVGRGGQVRATVTILMPALVVPGMGAHGGWHWTTSYAVRVDDYRSR